MQWYYLLQGQRQGPIDDAGLEALVRQGIVKDDTLVWREGLTEWHAFGSVRPHPAPPPRLDPAPARPEPAAPRPEPALPRPEPAPPRPEPAPPWQQPAAPRQQPASPGQAAFAPVSAAPAAGRTASHGAFFYYPVLDALSDGRVIRKFVIICLKVAAVLFALGGLLLALTALTAGLKGTGGTALGGILFAIIMLGTGACVGQIYWYRAGSVAALEHQTRNTVIGIFSILSRAGGEAAATGFAGFGLGACLYLWLSPEGLLGIPAGVPLLPQLPAEGGFLAGIVVLVYLAVLGFSALILGYLWAECLMLLVDIERNTRKSA